MISDISEGGINMPHLESFSKSLKMFWIGKLLDDTIMSDWKTQVSDNLLKYGGNNVWIYHPSAVKNLSKNFNPFWKNILEIWSEFYTCNDNPDPRSEPLWYNPNIKVGGKVIFYKHWFNAGINCVNDLLDNEGVLYEHREFVRNYNLNENFLRYNSVISAIPKIWKNIIINKEEKLALVEYENIKMVKLKNLNKHLYNKLLNKVKEYPTELETKWNLMLGDNNFNLTEKFSVIKELGKDSALKNFQFKILHQILPTNKLLYKMKIINYNSCYICSTHIESLEHMFYECIDIKNVWFRIFQDLNLREKFENLALNLDTVLFGYKNSHIKHLKGLNIFLILTKKYIFDCKQNDKKVSFEGAKFYLKNQCKIQKSVSKNADREWGFIDAWLEN